MPGKIRWETGCLLANAGLLVLVASALRFGVGAQRLRVAALFLMCGTASAIYAELLFHGCRRRARRQRERPVPQNVRLGTPWWIQAGGPMTLLASTAPVAALAGGLGSGQTGFGVLLAVAVLAGIVGYVTVRFFFRSLALEGGGLRLYFLGRTNLVVPWTSIASVEVTGQAEWKLVQLTLFETAGALASVQPNTPGVRRRAALGLCGDDGVAGRIVLAPWMAGLDAPVLARALNAAMSGAGAARPN